MLAKLRRGFTGIEILVLGALIVSLVTGTIATSDTAKKILFKPKASGTSQCSLVGSGNQIGCWCAEGGWQFHCFDPNQPLPEGADAYDCGVKCKALDANDNPPPPPALIDQPSNPKPYGKNWGNACSGVPYGKCSNDYRCVGGDKYDYNYFKKDDTCKPEDEFKPVREGVTVGTACSSSQGTQIEGYNRWCCNSKVSSTKCEVSIPATSSENCASKPKPTYCDPQFEEAICVSGSWTCEPIESKPESPLTAASLTIGSTCSEANGVKLDGNLFCCNGKVQTTSACSTTTGTTGSTQICTPNSFIGCDNSDQQKKMCNSAGTGHVYVSCNYGQKCDYANKKCSPSTQTSTGGPCDSTQTLPNYKEVSGKCLPSCGQLGTLAGVVATAPTNPCSESSLKDAGTSYDVKYCCIPSSSAVSTETSSQYCRFTGEYTCSTNKKNQQYCSSPSKPLVITSCPNNCNPTTGQCNPLLKDGERCTGEGDCALRCQTHTSTYTGGIYSCGEKKTTSTTSTSDNNSCPTNPYRCSTNILGKPISQKCVMNQGVPSWTQPGNDKNCNLGCNPTTGLCFNTGTTGSTATLQPPLSYGQECNPRSTATNSCLNCPDPQNTPIITVSGKQTTICGTPKSAEKLYCLQAGKYTCSSDNNWEILCINPRVPTVSTNCPNNCDTDTGRCKSNYGDLCSATTAKNSCSSCIGGYIFTKEKEYRCLTGSPTISASGLNKNDICPNEEACRYGCPTSDWYLDANKTRKCGTQNAFQQALTKTATWLNTAPNIDLGITGKRCDSLDSICSVTDLLNRSCQSCTNNSQEHMAKAGECTGSWGRARCRDIAATRTTAQYPTCYGFGGTCTNVDPYNTLIPGANGSTRCNESESIGIGITKDCCPTGQKIIGGYCINDNGCPIDQIVLTGAYENAPPYPNQFYNQTCCSKDKISYRSNDPYNFSARSCSP